MKTFVVAYISFYDSILTQQIIEAETWLDAACIQLNLDKADCKFDTIEDLDIFVDAQDCAISILEITDE